MLAPSVASSVIFPAGRGTEDDEGIAVFGRTEGICAQRLAGELKGIERERRQIIEQISDRKAEGRPRLPPSDDGQDKLEERRTGLEVELLQSPAEEGDFGKKISRLKAGVGPHAVELILNSALTSCASSPRKVVIGKTLGRRGDLPASLEVHGQIALCPGTHRQRRALESLSPRTNRC